MTTAQRTIAGHIRKAHRAPCPVCGSTRAGKLFGTRLCANVSDCDARSRALVA
jgi:hypothetical protein